MHDNSFHQYRRSQIAELRPYIPGEFIDDHVSISATDKEAGSPLLGDMIARNPLNHGDVWLVAAKYFTDNFEPLASDPPPASGKETSSRVSTIAGRLVHITADTVRLIGGADIAGRAVHPSAYDLAADIRSLAASCLTQDETPGQAPTPAPDFLDRLKWEREDLDNRLSKLCLYLAKGPGKGMNKRHWDMLKEQSRLMSNLLVVLDERVADLHIDKRSTSEENIK